MATELFEARVPVGGAVLDRPGGPGGTDRADDGGDGGRPDGAFDPAHFGLWLFLGTLTMLFIGFTSAYMVRRTALDWRAIPAPALLFWNTAALLLSSLSLEVARRRGPSAGGLLRAWLAATGVLAVLFAVGQVQAWKALAALGFFLSSNPHSAFFYLLSGVHLFHLAAGLVWFAAIAFGLRRRLREAGGPRPALSLFATYWHFLGGLWVYVLLLIFVF